MLRSIVGLRVALMVTASWAALPCRVMVMFERVDIPTEAEGEPSTDPAQAGWAAPAAKARASRGGEQEPVTNLSGMA